MHQKLLKIIIPVITIASVVSATHSISVHSKTKNEYNEIKNKFVLLEKKDNEEKNSSKEKDDEINSLKNKINDLNIKIKNLKDRYNKSLEGKKIAYLTFNSKPSGNTEKLLNALRSYNIKATFFVDNKEATKEEYTQIESSGHTIVNLIPNNISVENFEKEISELENSLEKNIGKKSEKLIRFQGGSDKVPEDIIKKTDELGYNFIDWTVDAKDSFDKKESFDEILQAVLNNSYGKDKLVLLMRDGEKTSSTVSALPTIIDELQMQGYEFRVLDEFIEGPKAVEKNKSVEEIKSNK